jgi:cytochrome c553
MAGIGMSTKTGRAITLSAAALLLATVVGLDRASASGVAAKGDRAFGEYLSSTCTTCHQITGRASGGVPPILAWPEDQFAAVMKSYRAKDRENQVMQAIAGGLTDEEIYALAAYFSSLPLQPEIK